MISGVVAAAVDGVEVSVLEISVVVDLKGPIVDVVSDAVVVDVTGAVITDVVDSIVDVSVVDNSVVSAVQ